MITQRGARAVAITREMPKYHETHCIKIASNFSHQRGSFEFISSRAGWILRSCLSLCHATTPEHRSSLQVSEAFMTLVQSGVFVQRVATGSLATRGFGCHTSHVASVVSCIPTRGVFIWVSNRTPFALPLFTATAACRYCSDALRSRATIFSISRGRQGRLRWHRQKTRGNNT